MQISPIPASIMPAQATRAPESAEGAGWARFSGSHNKFPHVAFPFGRR